MIDIFRDTRRAAEIVSVLGRFGAGVILRWLGLSSDTEGGQQLTPERLRLALEALGPVFIKLGQILSTRRDLLGPEWADELTRLQTRVVPLPWDQMSARIEAGLGQPIDAVFAEFDTTPIGSASIGQVYRARLPGGEAVVVKVTRPGVADKVAADLQLLEQAVTHAERISPALRRYRPREMVQELARALTAELDLREEARNSTEVAANLAELPAVTIPGIFPDISSRDVLVQQMVDGIAPTDHAAIAAAGLDGPTLARNGAEAFMQMVLVDRVFHADPHPGNLFALTGNRVAFIDFGMVGRLGTARQRELVQLMRALVMRDAPGLAKVLATWGAAPQAQERLEGDSARFIARHGRNGLDLAQAVNDMMDIMRDNELGMPPDLVLLLKALATADGTMKLLDPQFDTISAARPFVERDMLAKLSGEALLERGRTLLEETAELATDAPQLVRGALSRISEGRLRAEISLSDGGDVARALERSGQRIATALVIAAFVIATAAQISGWGPEVMGMRLGAWAQLAGLILGGLWLLVIGGRRRG